MTGVDLSVYRFDYDLTFAALLMHPDGTIYHTVGGRDFKDPMSHLDMGAFVSVMKATLADHEAYSRAPAPPKPQKKITIEDWKRRAQNRNKPDCMHCHMIGDWQREARKLERKWMRNDAFRWPDPVQIGLEFGPDLTITKVSKGSPAHKAGLAAGARLIRVGAQKIRTFGDIQRGLEDGPKGAGGLEVAWLRGAEKETRETLRLSRDWRVPTPEVFAWRNSMWGLPPWPGFGGRKLNPEQVAKQGLPEGAWAMRVGYLVTWGPRAYTGQNAHKAGLRKGDIILSIGGKSDFSSERHFQAWFRFTYRKGDRVKIEVLRKGKRERLTLPVLD